MHLSPTSYPIANPYSPQEGKFVAYPELRDALTQEGKRVLATSLESETLNENDRRILRDTTMACLEVFTLFG